MRGISWKSPTLTLFAISVFTIIVKVHLTCFEHLPSKRLIEELTVVNDCRHSETTENWNVVVNLALALSVRDLHEKCKVYAIQKGVTEENILSLSWFKFQFWPKSSYMATAMNYTGRFKVGFMVQQRNIRKFSPDDHYYNALFKHAKQLAIKFSDHSALISTDDKCQTFESRRAKLCDCSCCMWQTSTRI